MRILYVSDLDGTLLRSDAKTSAYTNQVINKLTAKGMLFSYATARSHL
ncbi:MAG: HAD hydrolase family protein, partial [Acutalibacter sp.]|nr:HAD hydrolase family protein [Acutalibacter sp.]